VFQFKGECYNSMVADLRVKNLEDQIEHLLQQYASCMPDESQALAMSIRGAAEVYHELTGRWYVRVHSSQKIEKY
jgi:hypothetical protein